MHSPREPHLAALKWIVRYIRGILDFGLHVPTTSQYADIFTKGLPSCLQQIQDQSERAQWLTI
jgi:hypothetical protein